MPSDNSPQKRLERGCLTWHNPQPFIVGTLEAEDFRLKFLDSNFFLFVLSFWGANLLSGHLHSAGYLLLILRPAVVFRSTGQPDGLSNELTCSTLCSVSTAFGEG